MGRNGPGKRGLQDSAPQHVQPEKVGWIRKFCGKGIFREIWKNRFVVLRGDQLLICEKEVKECGGAEEVLDLSDYERCEDVRKNKSRSKKNLSKFRLQRCSSPGNTVPNLVFLAVSPEDKDSWINVLNAAITRAKNRILDEVTVEDSQLLHLTRNRAKIPHNRRPPTRGHLVAVASSCSSDGTLTLDLIQEEDAPPAEDRDAFRAHREKNTAPPRTAEDSGKSPKTPPTHCSVDVLQELINLKMEATERLLTEVRGGGGVTEGGGEVGEEGQGGKGGGEAEKLLQEAAAAWKQAHEVLQEVKELRNLHRQMDPPHHQSNNKQPPPPLK